MVGAVDHPEVIAARAAGHVADPDHLARLLWHKTLAHQIEIADAVDLVVIGNTGVAIAEADLRPHIELDVAAAGGRIAAERAAGGPAIARERPGDFTPAGRARNRGTDTCMLKSGHAGQRTYRNSKSDRQPAHVASSNHHGRANIREDLTSGKTCRLARGPGQLEDMHSGIGAIDYIDVSAVVGLDIVRLYRDF